MRPRTDEERKAYQDGYADGKREVEMKTRLAMRKILLCVRNGDIDGLKRFAESFFPQSTSGGDGRAIDRVMALDEVLTICKRELAYIADGICSNRLHHQETCDCAKQKAEDLIAKIEERIG